MKDRWSEPEMDLHVTKGAAMRRFSLIHRQARTNGQANRCADGFFDERARQNLRTDPVRFPTNSKEKRDHIQSPQRAGEFFKDLSTEALRDFDSIAEHFSIPESTILFREGQEPSGVLFLVKGNVKLSVNSIDGGRLILGIAGPGKILGLTSAVLGCPYDMTAEAKFTCMISSVHQKRFLEFLIDHPLSIQNVARELSMEGKRAYEQLRNLGLNLTAPAKLARLIMDWTTTNEHEGARCTDSLLINARRNRGAHRRIPRNGDALPGRS